MTEFAPVSLAELRVTQGTIDAGTSNSEFVVRAPATRAQLISGRHVGARGVFKFLGVSDETTTTASGLILTQFGLKLRAANTCNLIYVTWRLAPDEQVVVLVKRNPGAILHGECGNGGYHRVAELATGANTFASGADGEPHILEAKVEEDATGFWIRVNIDDYTAPPRRLAPSQLQGVEGPCGLRTDNGKFDFQFFKSI